MAVHSVRYLVKFIPEEMYVDSLINTGELFMRPLGCFVDLEKRQSDHVRGDIREGLLLNCIWVNSDRPIYCMYTVFESDVVSDSVLINKRAVQKFLPQEEGYFAIINYGDFISQLKADYFEGYAVYTNIVTYGSLDRETQKQMLMNDNVQAAFFKQTSYSYQQEFRLVVDKILPKIMDEEAINENESIGGEDPPIDRSTCGKYFACIGSLQHCAKKYSKKDLIDYNGTHFILKS